MNPIAAKLLRDISRPLTEAAAKAGRKLLNKLARKRLNDLKEQTDNRGQA